MGVRVDGSKVRIFGTKKAAQDGARSLGWPVSCVYPVETRFQMAYALGMGVDRDPYTGLGYMSRERFGELYRGRNGNAEPKF
jgi:hypothetical protein